MSDEASPSLQRLSSFRSEMEKVVFETLGVSGEISDGVNSIISVEGRLTLVERVYGVFVEFNTVDNQPKSMEDSSWEITNEGGGASATDDSKAAQKMDSQKRHANFSLDLKDIRSFKMVKCGNPPEATIRFHAKDGTSYTPLRFHSSQSNSEGFVTALQKYVTLKRSAKEDNLILVTDEKTEALQQSVSLLFKERSSDFVSRLWSDPYTTALSSLGKVTNFLQDQVRAAMLEMNELDADEQKQCIDSLRELQKRDDEANADNLHFQQEPGDFEMITKLEFPARPIVPRNEAVTAAEWSSFVNVDGSVSNVRELKFRIFRGGLEHTLRAEAWKYLLGYYDWSLTKFERDELSKQRKDDYYRMKLQWRTISEDQEKRFNDYRDRKALIEKDVARTDRNHKFYEGEHNAQLDTLTSVLLTYVMYNFDVGYVQGMSDLLSPILVVMENEVDAFWTFAGFMNKVFQNFEMDQKSIRNQLMQLRDLTMVVNPKLANYLESHESDNMYFCFRWILVLFKREFGFSDIMRLWEVLWTDLPCKNFHLLICLAILDMQSIIIMENRFGFTEILKHVNDLSMHIPLEETLKTAEGIFHQLAAVQDKLPSHICEILGFQNHAAVSPVVSPMTPPKPAPGMAQRKTD